DIAEELDLFKLVDALDATDVAAGAHLLAAKTHGLGGIEEGQGPRFEDFAAVKVGERRFSGRDEPEVLFRVVVKVLPKLGQVAGAEEVFFAHDKGWVDLGVAVLAGVDIEHEVDERTLEAGARALEDIG